MKLPTGVAPFRLARKLAKHVPPTKYPVARLLASISEDGEEDSVCIKVEAEDGLYLTRNYIVTHNTPVVLTYLDALYLGGETRPTLILGPLRVARKVWSDEVQKWDHLAGLSVVPIIGTEKERLAALRIDAPIYTINYDNLVWLIEYWGERWPYATVVADESDYIKGHRISFRTAKNADGSDGKTYLAGQGAKRAGALAKIAHSHTKRFIELTGTPAPNGLVDLWGQIWYLDRGQRLGRTFDAFKKRWFEKAYDGFGSTPHAFANDQIHAALNDICLTIDGKDWFDLKKPIVNNIYVDLGPKARKLYKDMEKEMFLQLEDSRSAEAFGAAARTQKLLQLCLAAGTEVLTPEGWVPIENLDAAQPVWDGLDWVSVGKLLVQGKQSVINCLGVWMTEGHRVRTTEGWRTAGEINARKTSSGFDRAGFWIPDRFVSRGVEAPDAKGYLARALHLWGRIRGHKPEFAEHEPWFNEVVWVPSGGDADRSLGDPRHDLPSGVEYLERDAAAMSEPQQQGLGKLWRAGHSRMRTLAKNFRGLLRRYGSVLVSWGPDRPDRQQRKLRAGELPLDDGKGAGEQHQDKCVDSDAERKDDGEASSRGFLPEVCNPAQAVGERMDPLAGGNCSGQGGEAETYDLADVGPRNQFVARGPAGDLLLVHNCNGAIYLDPLADSDTSPRSKEWRLIHDEKIEALQSIAHEAAGEALLVCYEFKSDLARLLHAFPKGRVMKTDKDIEDFIAGKIPMLFLHPKSGGHGVDGLQYACRHIVFFGHNWSLGQYQQVIERTGPVRQMQAGLDRLVFIHHIIARGTVDELVMERRETKREVQDILLDACNRSKKA